VRPSKPREIACLALLDRENGQGFLEDLLDQALASVRLSAPDRALVHELVCGVVRWQAPLDWLIAQKAGDRRQLPIVQVLLRLGLYQLFWLDRIPDHAAVGETVELAPERQAGFINAILRGFAREREVTRLLLERLKRDEPALGWSHPDWLVQRWIARWGKPQAIRLLESNNQPARVFARVNTLIAEPDKLIAQWRREDVQYDFGRWDWIPENLVFELRAHPPLARLDSFRRGWFYVQDPSTCLAPRLLAPQPGDRLLDLCAAPGGKSTFLAQMLENDARLVAVEPAAARRARLAENCERLNADCTVVESIEAAPLREFDRILVDAPCSNTGVIRRRLDLRWRVRLEEVLRLREVQLGLLAQAAPVLRPGGTLAYSTCSLEPEENRGVVDAFLAAHPDFRLAQERELFPPDARADGAYVAILLKAEA
jgi:16S rRNA (cytosine967-C5)-methyltransferase